MLYTYAKTLPIVHLIYSLLYIIYTSKNFQNVQYWAKIYIFYGAITNKQYTSAIVKAQVPKIQNSSYYEPIVYLNEYAF